MAERKRTDEQTDDGGRFHAINAMGTVVLVGAADFKARYEPAGYHRLKADETAPFQQHEIETLGLAGAVSVPDRAAILNARQARHGHTRHPLPPAETAAPA